MGDDATKIADMLEDFIGKFQRTAETGLFFLPWLKYISKKYSGYTDLENICGEIHGYIKDAIERERLTWERSKPPRHLIDCYLQVLDSMKDVQDSAFYGDLGYLNSVAGLGELFLGGVEATAATLTWLMYYLIWNPEVTDKLVKEIDTVIGNGLPSLEHRQR